MPLTFPITPTWIDRTSGNTPLAFSFTQQRWSQRIVQIGSVLLANLVPSAGLGGAPNNYRSSDGGKTWTLPTPTSSLSSAQASGRAFVFNGLMYVASAGNPGIPEMASYDPSTDAWATPTAVDFTNNFGFPTNERKIWVCIRPDGSKVSVFSEGDATFGRTSIQISVDSGGGWSRVGVFLGTSPGNSWRFPYSIFMDVDGHVHIIGIGSDDSSRGSGATQQIYHMAVDPSNTLSSEQMLDTVEIDFDGAPDLRPSYAQDITGTTLGFAYPWQIETWQSGDGTPAIKAVIGDLTNPMSPTWLNETITTDVAKMPNSNRIGQQVKCMFNGSGQLEAYWTARIPGLDYNTQLWQSTRTAPGVWSTPALAYQSPPDPDLGSDNYAITGFDLLLVDGTVRIMIDTTGDGDFSSPHYLGVGYTPPSATVLSYAHTRGARAYSA